MFCGSDGRFAERTPFFACFLTFAHLFLAAAAIVGAREPCQLNTSCNAQSSTLEDSRARLLDSLFETPLGDWGELGVTCFALLENGRDENLGKIR